MLELVPYMEKIQSLCKKTQVKELYIFGSALTGKFTPSSDVDLLVDFNADSPAEYSRQYFALKFQLEDLFGRQVDLLETRALKNPHLLAHINKDKTLIYAA